jgi:hypothetical protein
MSDGRIETTLFELAVALQSVCDDDRDVVLAMLLCLAPGHRALLAAPAPRPRGARPMLPAARALPRRPN